MNAAMLAVIYGGAIAPQNATEIEVVRAHRASESIYLLRVKAEGS